MRSWSRIAEVAGCESEYERSAGNGWQTMVLDFSQDSYAFGGGEEAIKAYLKNGR